jgi:hypothetical protein
METMTIWIKYEPNGSNDYVPVFNWDKDHWSTFAYLETCVVDAEGMIDNRRMRCSARLHREFAHIDPVLGRLLDSSKYPTRLKDGEIENHDDWSCLEDMVEAGLIEAWWNTKPGQPFGGGKAKVALTKMGFVCAALLREHKANGGSFGTFDPTYKE